jgi:tetratricopeptide (TPR) repeat protein
LTCSVLTKSKNTSLLLICLGLAILTTAIYWPTTGHDFVNFDDPDYVSENPRLHQGINPESIRWAFTSIHSTNWHPLTTLSHMLDWQLFGQNAGAHHLISLLLHVANSLLLLLLLSRLTGTVWPSALVAALFALHPLHVESVAWISERKDVLSGFFFFLTLLAYECYARGRGGVITNQNPESRIQDPGSNNPTIQKSKNPIVFYGLALLAFACGLLSKPMLVTLPFVLLLLDFWPLRRWAFPLKNQRTNILNLLLEKAPFFALSIASCIITFVVQKKSGTVMAIEMLPFPARLADALIAYAMYLGKALWPLNLAVFYPLLPKSLLSWQTLAALALLLGVTILVFKERMKRPFLLAGWLWFLGMLVPVIGIVQVGDQAMADRYTYLPFIGLFIIAAWFLLPATQHFNPSSSPSNQNSVFSDQDAGSSNPPIQQSTNPGATALLQHSIAPISLLLLAACCILTLRQLPVWQNTETLFQHAIAVTKNNHTAYANLGIYYVQHGRFDDAISCYQAALQAKTNFPHAWNNLGLALVHQKKFEEGVACFEKALSQYANLPETECNLGNALVALHKPEEAIQHYGNAVRLKPDYALARENLGGMLVRSGKAAEAIPHLRAAIELNPKNAATHIELARALSDQGDPVTAETEFRKALELKPESLSARLGLAQALLQQGNSDKAMAEYEQVLKLEPRNADALCGMAMSLNAQGKSREAAKYYEKALAEQPDFISASNDLAWILATSPFDDLRDGKRAVALAENACKQTDFHEPLFLGTLAAAYAEAGRFPEAIATAQKAKVLAEKANQTELASRNQQLLELYKANKPYHEPAEAGQPQINAKPHE